MIEIVASLQFTVISANRPSNSADYVRDRLKPRDDNVLSRNLPALELRAWWKKRRERNA
jgi:hypothetical protein